MSDGGWITLFGGLSHHRRSSRSPAELRLPTSAGLAGNVTAMYSSLAVSCPGGPSHRAHIVRAPSPQLLDPEEKCMDPLSRRRRGSTVRAGRPPLPDPTPAASTCRRLSALTLALTLLSRGVAHAIDQGLVRQQSAFCPAAVLGGHRLGWRVTQTVILIRQRYRASAGQQREDDMVRSDKRRFLLRQPLE
jgi:hypothetical protein